MYVNRQVWFPLIHATRLIIHHNIPSVAEQSSQRGMYTLNYNNDYYITASFVLHAIECRS